MRRTVNRMSHFVTGLALLIAGGVALFLMTWEMPAPVTPIEKVIPNDRFAP